MAYFRYLSLFMVIARTSGSRWDNGIDGVLLGEVIELTETPYPTLNIYSDVSLGTNPKHYPGEPKSGLIGKEGRLDSRAPTCSSGYILACPATEHNPCCSENYPVCSYQICLLHWIIDISAVGCHDPSDKCCKNGYFCVGLRTCCINGQIGCGEGCCEADQICCGTKCCNSSTQACRSGTCVQLVDPSQSYQSVQSLASVASVASVVSVASTASVASVASVVSVESMESRHSEQSMSSFATQSRASVSSVSVASIASVSSASLASLTTTQDTSVSSETGATDNGSSKNQAIIGGSVGGGLAAILLAITMFLCLRKRMSSSTVAPLTEPVPMTQPSSSPVYTPGYTQGYTSGYTPGHSSYTSGGPGITPALVYNESTPPSGTQTAGSGMPMWLQHNHSDMQARPFSMTSTSSLPHQNHVLPGYWTQEESHEGNASVYPSNAVTFYGPNDPDAPPNRFSNVVNRVQDFRV
ncbi:hypothetical protein CPB86DRAFT_568329 [Serendipita vermifera]|nr:hypothetical protein CPB86DRAFT_568329 [Serendipita vermifera]